MYSKKSQVALFLILGFIILIGFAFAVYIKDNAVKQPEIEKTTNILFDANPIKLYVQNCIESTGKNALILIGKQGGYYQLKKPNLEDDNFNLPYYIFDNLDFSPSLEQIEKEISKYVDGNIQYCINDFEEFRKQGFDITDNVVKSNTRIGTNSVSIDVNFPIEIRKEDNIQKIDNFNMMLNNVHLSNIHKVIKEVIDFQLNNPNSVCLSCLYKLAEENNLYIDIIQYQNNSLIFNIRDYNITEDNIIKSPYNYTFAVKLEDISCNNFIGTEDQFFVQRCIDELIKNSTKEIQIKDIPDFRIKIKETFYYKIDASGTNLIFNVYSDIFYITNSSILTFVPNREQIGNHSIWLSVKDILGNERFKNFNIEVLE